MSEYCATIRWRRADTDDFIKARYSRGHQWSFDGGAVVPASSSPHVVPLPYSVAANIDPEEAFVASLSSCHMLFFLAIAAKRGFVVDEYIDEAAGIMGRDSEDNIAMTKVLLSPKVTFSGDMQPDRGQIQQIHHQAHNKCFIANSVKSTVVIEIPE